MKHQLIILNASGDTRYEWPEVVESAADEKVLAEAQAAFDAHVARGYMAFETTTAAPEKGKVVKKFRREAERTTLVPQFVGGRTPDARQQSSSSMSKGTRRRRRSRRQRRSRARRRRAARAQGRAPSVGDREGSRARLASGGAVLALLGACPQSSSLARA